MWQMVKRDWMMNWSFILMVAALPLLVHLFSLPNVPLTVYLTFFIVIFAYVFYYDQKNNVIRTIVSLPISKHKIVLARYIFFFIVFTLFLLYVWLLNQEFPGYLILFTFTVLCIGIAISLPIYYQAPTFLVAAFIQFAVLVLSSLGFLLLAASPYAIFDPIFFFVFDLIEIQPVFTLLLSAFISLCISYFISCFIFAKKDIV